MELRTRQNTYFFMLLFGGVVFLSFLVVQPYILLAIMAFLITALYRPVHKKILKRTKNMLVANTFTMMTIFISILIPLALVTFLTVNQVLQFNRDLQAFLKVNNIPVEEVESEVQNDLTKPTQEDLDKANPDEIGQINVNTVINKVNDIIADLPFETNYELTRTDVNKFIKNVIGPVSSFLADTGLSLVSSTLTVITYAFVFIFLLSTFLSSEGKIIAFYKKISPLDDKIDEMYINRLKVTGIAMIKGVFVVAIAQGIVSGIFLYIAGVEYVVFWTLLTILVSIIPLGSGVINIPIGIILLLTGSVPGGLLIILGNILIVGTIDNLLRPLLVPKEVDLHHVLVLLGALGGIQFFGPLGFIYGPIVMIILKTTLEVYVKYYKS